MARAHIYRTRTDRERWRHRRRNGVLRRQLHKMNVRSRAMFGIFGNQYALLTDSFGAHGLKKLMAQMRALAKAPRESQDEWR